MNTTAALLGASGVVIGLEQARSGRTAQGLDLIEEGVLQLIAELKAEQARAYEAQKNAEARVAA